MNRTILWVLVAMLASGLAACGGDTGSSAGVTDAGPTKTLKVYTSCFPVDWLTRRVAGEHADVTHILPTGEDPPDWTPPAEVVGQMQTADRIVINGAGFEGWVATTTLPADRIVDTSAGLELIELEETTHSHGKDGEHTHKGVDPHTWSNPTVAAAQAATIRDALIEADPAHAGEFKANYDALATELGDLDEAYRAACAGYDGQPMATSHPAFNYLARRYGLELINFGFEPDEVPDEEALGHFRHEREHHPFELMLWEAAPTEEVRAAFDATGVKSVFLDPLEQPPEGGAYDYLAQARGNVATLKGLFGPAEPADPEAKAPATEPESP